MTPGVFWMLVRWAFWRLVVPFVLAVAALVGVGYWLGGRS